MKKNSQEIHFSTGVKYKGRYYLTAMRTNMLFMYDEQKDKLTFLACFQKEEKKEVLYIKSFLYKDEAWFIPFQADYIAVVNLDKLSIEYIPLQYQKIYYNTYVKYINFLFFRDKYLCLIPQDVDAAMVIDLESKKTQAYYGIVGAERNYYGAVFYNNKICFFPWKEENVLILDLRTDERVYRSWSEENEAFGDVVYDERSGQLFHAPAKSNYIRIDNLHCESLKKVIIDNRNEKKYKTYYASDREKEIYFWGHEEDIVLKVSKEDGSAKQYYVPHNPPGIYYFPICSEDIEALIFDGNCIVKYDIKNDLFYNIYINTTLNDILCEMKKSGIDIEIVMGNVENNFFGLQQYMYYVPMKKNNSLCHEKTCIGNLIYKSICTL